MGEILMGRFLSKHRLTPFFLVVFAFTLQTAEEVAPDRMDLDACYKGLKTFPLSHDYF